MGSYCSVQNASTEGVMYFKYGVDQKVLGIVKDAILKIIDIVIAVAPLIVGAPPSRSDPSDLKTTEDEIRGANIKSILQLVDKTMEEKGFSKRLPGEWYRSQKLTLSLMIQCDMIYVRVIDSTISVQHAVIHCITGPTKDSVKKFSTETDYDRSVGWEMLKTYDIPHDRLITGMGVLALEPLKTVTELMAARKVKEDSEGEDETELDTVDGTIESVADVIREYGPDVVRAIQEQQEEKEGGGIGQK